MLSAGRNNDDQLRRGASLRSDLRGPKPCHAASSIMSMNITREVVERVYREESGRILATLIRVVGDFDLADDALQDAFAKALKRWPVAGLPDNPGAWITRAARNRLIDRLRRIRSARTVSLADAPPDRFANDALDDYRVTSSIDGAMLDKELDSSLEDDRLRL